jgi:hypothetical protein
MGIIQGNERHCEQSHGDVPKECNSPFGFESSTVIQIPFKYFDRLCYLADSYKILYNNFDLKIFRMENVCKD